VIVHPAPNAPNSTGETDKKKRKREVGENNDHVLSDTLHARFPNSFHANKHLVTVHETLKRECEQLIELTVSSVFLVSILFSTFVSFRTKLSCG
jgi:proteasome activator subunit 3 (PA28 gamma)